MKLGKFSIGSNGRYIFAGGHVQIATIHNEEQDRDETSASLMPKKSADKVAALLAAAPEILEALEIVLTQFGDYTDGDGAAKYHAVNIAKAAIAKARGES